MARARKTKGKSKTSVNVNFKGVESRRTPPEGDYKCKVLEATAGTSGAGNDQIEFVAEIASGEYKGQKLYLYCPLQENSLWKLHAFLTALGVDVPEDDMDIDLTELVDEEFMGVITHETYNGRKRAKLTDFDSIDNYDGKDEDDDEDEDDKKSSKKSKSKKAGKGKSKADDDDEDEDDEDEAPKKGKKSKKSKSDDDDEDEDDEPKKKGKSKKSKKDDDDEDEDEDDEPKKGKKSKSKKKAKTYDRDEVEDMDEDELEELIEESGIDVDLDDYKKLPKKVAAVIEALEEADLLDD